MMKSNLELVQELFESQINSLNEKVDDKFDSLTDKIDSNNQHTVELLNLIREQTTKTNGRMTIAEGEIRELNSANDKHVVNCPRLRDIVNINDKIDKLNEENLILKIWNKYPKQLLTFFVAAIIITLVTLSYTVYVIHKTIKEVKVEQVLQNDRLTDEIDKQ